MSDSVTHTSRWHMPTVKSLYARLPSGHRDIHTLMRVMKAAEKQVGDEVKCKDKYHHAVGIDFGRRYAPHTYQTLSRSSRVELATTLYADLDFVACHPTMLLHAFKTATIESPKLKEYITDRENIIARIVAEHPTLDRVTVKAAFNVATYLGSYKKHATGRNVHVPILERFTRELRDNAKLLAGRPEYADLYALAKKRKEDGKSPNGTFLSYVCQRYEARCKNTLMEYLASRNVVTGVDMHDGLMVERSSIDDLDALLVDANAHITAALQIEHLKVIHKPMVHTTPAPFTTTGEGVQLVLFTESAFKATRRGCARSYCRDQSRSLHTPPRRRSA